MSQKYLFKKKKDRDRHARFIWKKDRDHHARFIWKKDRDHHARFIWKKDRDHHARFIWKKDRDRHARFIWKKRFNNKNCFIWAPWALFSLLKSLFLQMHKYHQCPSKWLGFHEKKNITFITFQQQKLLYLSSLSVIFTFKKARVSFLKFLQYPKTNLTNKKILKPSKP